MNKILAAFICVLVSIVLFTSCSGDKIDNENMTIPAHSAPPPTYFGSVDDLHDYLLSARAYSKGTVSPMVMGFGEETEMKTAVNDWDLGDIQYHYLPSWLPEEFKLGNISVTDRYIGYTYATEDLIASYNLDFEYVLNNEINFEWVKAVTYITEEFVTHVVERQGRG